MKITKITEKDTNELVSFIQTYKKEQQKELSKIQIHNIENAIDQLVTSSSSFGYICIDDKNKILGYIIMHLINFPMLCGKELYISDLFIDKLVRGQGIGKQLIIKANEIADENMCERIMLNNPKEYESYKRSFYSKLGFIERSNFANFVRNLRE